MEYKLSDDPAYKELHEIATWLAGGNFNSLEFASEVVDSFPNGKDNLLGSHWITHAVASGCLDAVNWMIKKGVDLRIKENDGYPPIFICIDGSSKDKYQILEVLIRFGADINERGINGWTPLHLAAIRDDEKSMLMLLMAGADKTIRTDCDDNATAEEEARILGHFRSADLIENFQP